MMERHYCAHPSIPGYGPPDAIGIKRWAVLGELVPAWSLGTLGSLWPQAHTHLEDNDDTRKPVSHKTCTNVLSKARPVAEGNRSLSIVRGQPLSFLQAPCPGCAPRPSYILPGSRSVSRATILEAPQLESVGRNCSSLRNSQGQRSCSGG